MAALFCGDWWLKAVAGRGAYEKHVARASTTQVDPKPVIGVPCADHNISATKRVPATQQPPPTLALSQAVVESRAPELSSAIRQPPSSSTGPQAVPESPAPERSPSTSHPPLSPTLPRIVQDSPFAEPASVTSQAPSSLEIPLQASSSALSSSIGITPPSPASLYTETLSQEQLFPHSSTPEELRRLEEFLQLSKQAQLEAFVTPEEFLVVSIDVYAGNMAQKHYEGSPWGASLAWTNEELEGKCSIPEPFPSKPRVKVRRPPGYYDDALQQGGEKRPVYARREKLRERQAEKATKVARAKAEKVARAVEKAAGGAEKKAKAPEDVKGKGKAVQWAEDLESHWHYSGAEEDHMPSWVDED